MPHCSSRINAYQETTGNDGSKSLVPGMNVKAVEMCMIARSSLATVEVYIDREGMI